MKNRKALIIIVMALLLFLGLSLGTSITMFIFFLNSHDDLLAIISYLALALFTLAIVFEAFLIFTNKALLLNRIEDVDNEKE